LLKLQRDLEATREQLKRSTDKIQELEGHSSYLVTRLQQQETLQRMRYLQKAPHNNGIEMDLWGSVPNDSPLIMYDRTSLRLVGCNEAFRSISGYDIQNLRGCHVGQVIAEQFREPWAKIVEWKLRAYVKSLSGCLLLKFKDRDCAIRVTCHNEANYIWTNLEVIDYFSDEWKVNDLYLPPTFKVPFNPTVGSLLSPPPASLNRLMDVIRSMGEIVVKTEDHADQSQDESRSPQQQSHSPQSLVVQPPQSLPQLESSYSQMLNTTNNVQPTYSQSPYVTHYPETIYMPMQHQQTTFAYDPNEYMKHEPEPISVDVSDILEILSNYAPQQIIPDVQACDHIPQIYQHQGNEMYQMTDNYGRRYV
jgi:hypothetical protein